MHVYGERNSEDTSNLPVVNEQNVLLGSVAVRAEYY